MTGEIVSVAATWLLGGVLALGGMFAFLFVMFGFVAIIMRIFERNGWLP